MDEDFSQCLLLNTVMAARALTRRYDERLRPFDVSVVQFSVMAIVDGAAGRTVTDMAKRIAVDRTTMLRNLDLLVRKGLVKAEPAEKGNGRVFELTDTGQTLLAQLIPEWRKAQTELRTLLVGHDKDGLLDALQILKAV